MNAPAVLGIISYKVFPAKMGGQKCVVDFYEHLAARTRLVLAVARQNGAGTNRSYKVLPFLFDHWSGILNIFYLHRLKELIRVENIDVIIIEHSYFGWLGVLLRRITKKKFVIRSHNIEALRFRDMRRSWWRLYQWYEKRVHRAADHSFFITAEDRAWAVSNWQLDDHKCTVATYGTDILHAPSPDSRLKARNELVAEHGLLPATQLFLFNGTLNYLPNTDALRIIMTELLPLLTARLFDFRLFVCGTGLDEQWASVLRSHPGIIYTGYVDDIGHYLSGVDHFINPITLGGGIRTKLVEAIAGNLHTISTRTGAQGIPASLAATKLVLVDDYDWPAFAKAMSGAHLYSNTDTSPEFYRAFNWDTIVQKALLSLQAL